MITDVDEALAELLLSGFKALGNDLIKDRKAITSAAPAEVDAKSGPCLSLYLHDLSENRSLRDNTFRVAKPNSEGSTKLRGPVTFDLKYILTAHAAGDTSKEHELLADALTVLLKAQAKPPAGFVNALEEKSVRFISFEIAQPEHPAHADQSGIWRVMGGILHPSLGLSITASFNPYEPKPVKLVRESIFGFGQSDSNGEARRPLDLTSTRACAAGIVIDDKEIGLQEVFVRLTGSNRSTMTDENGFFCFFDLEVKEAHLSLSREGYESREISCPVVPMGRSDLFDPGTITLRALDTNQRIAEQRARLSAERADASFINVKRSLSYQVVGQLKDAEGKPAQYLMVRLGNQTAMTDSKGFYHFDVASEREANSAELVALVPDPAKGVIREVKITNPQGETVLAAVQKSPS